MPTTTISDNRNIMRKTRGSQYRSSVNVKLHSGLRDEYISVHRVVKSVIRFMCYIQNMMYIIISSAAFASCASLNIVVFIWSGRPARTEYSIRILGLKKKRIILCEKKIPRKVISMTNATLIEQILIR